MSLKKISISARLILVMSLIAVLTAGLSAYLILRFIESGKQVRVLAEEGTQGIVWGEKANFYLHNLIINFYRANSGDMKWVKAMEDNIPRIRDALNEYAKTARDPENRRLLAETYEALDIYAQDIVELGQAFRQGIYGPAIIDVLNRLETKPHANRLITDIKNLVEYSKAMAEKNRASFFADMSANTRASIVLACVVLLILVLAGFTGVVWTRDEIAEHNATEAMLKKLQDDLQNSLEAAGAISRQISFDSGRLSFVGEVEKVLGLPAEVLTNFVSYVRQIHPEDRGHLLNNSAWDQVDNWDEYIRLHPDDFITIDGHRLLRQNSSLVRRWIEQAGSASATNHREFRCPAPAGDERKWRWKRSLSKLLPHSSGQGYTGESGILFDITKEYEMRDELIRAKYDAEAASRAKSDFLARMSHEIRTPMNAIIGMTHLLLRTQLSDAQQDYLAKIRTSAQVLLDIIKDILDFSKIEADRMQLEELPFRLDEVLKSLADVTLIRAQEKELEMIFSVSDDTPQYLIGDSLRLAQILINLTNNAIKFTASGEILINVGVIERNDSEVQLHFSVTDTGIGLTSDQIKLLFQPFTQADGTITRRFGGTGLGLAISKSLVEAMDGRIWVESQPGKGSTFHFTIRRPVAPDQPAHIVLPSDLRHLRTLVIDDNPTARDSLTDMLGALFSAPPVGTASLEEAMQHLLPSEATHIPFEIIFVDWQMPEVNGLETARRLRRLAQQTDSQTSIILMLPSSEMEKVRPAAQLAGVETFLVKPTCPSDLFDVIATLCGHKSRPEMAAHIVVSREMLDRIRGNRVLLVEDNPFNQQVARELLEQAGIEVEVAENGFAALEKITEGTWDLVLMDIQMPDLDGLDVTRRIRKNIPAADLPIIALTAHALNEDRQKSLEAGMNDHLTKPIDPEELLAMLVKWGKAKHCPLSPEGSNPGGSAAGMTTSHSQHPEGNNYTFTAIDQHLGLKRSMNNRASYFRLLRLFYQEYGDVGERCRDHLNRGEYDQLGRLAHTIKGPAGSIGATELEKSARELELAVQSSQGMRLDEVIRSFQNALARVILDLDPIVLREEEAHSKEQPASRIHDRNQMGIMLHNLRSCLEKNDPAAASIAREFGQVGMSPEQTAQWQELQTNIRSFDFEEALETLTAIEKWLRTSATDNGNN